MALGGMLYGVMYIVRRDVPTESVVVPPETIRALLQQREELTGNALTPDEKNLVVRGYVDDEVLLHEARLRGFDLNDYRVR